MKKIVRRKNVEEGFADKAGAFGRGLADKATFGGYKYARAAADYGVKSGLKKLGIKGGEDTTYQRELDQEKEKLTKDSEKEPLASGLGDAAGYAVAYSPIGGAIKAVKNVVDTGKDYLDKGAPVADKLQRGIQEDENTDKVMDIANSFKKMSGDKKLPDIDAPGVPDMFKVKKKIQEEGEGGAPANSAGGGNIAGIGVPNPAKGANFGEPGISKKVQKKHTNILRRKKPAALQEAKMGKFAGNDTFIVSSDKYHTARNEKKKGKHWKKYIGEDECGMQIREYANKNSKKPIILQDENTGAMCYARYGKK